MCPQEQYGQAPSDRQMSSDQNEAQRSLLADPNQMNVTHGNLLVSQMEKAILIYSLARRNATVIMINALDVLTVY